MSFRIAPSEFTGDDRIRLIVSAHRLDGDSFALGTNSGWRARSQSSIDLDLLFSLRDDARARDLLLAAFVAEAAEVLLEFQSTHAGDFIAASSSHGEAFSRVFAGTLEPSGYALLSGFLSPDPGLNLGGAGTTDAWMNSARDVDFISANLVEDPDGTPADRNIEAFGAATLFIYYLTSQLHLALADVIAAPGRSLGAKYQALMDSADRHAGWDAFRELVDGFFPVAVGGSYRLPTDNPFPLLPPRSRSVSIGVSEQTYAMPQPLGDPGQANVSPGFPCPAADYAYQAEHLFTRLVLTATLSGFGIPELSWTLNGHPLIDSRTYQAITVSTPVAAVDPPVSGAATPVEQSVDLEYTMDFGPFAPTRSHTLTVDVTHPVGDVYLFFSLDVREQHASPDVTSASAMGTSHTIGIQYEPRYYDDQRRCHANAIRVLQRLFKVNPLWRIMPDPPPDFRTAAILLRELQREPVELAVRDPSLAAQAWLALQLIGSGEEGGQPKR